MFSMPVKNCIIRILPPLNPHVMGSPLTKMWDSTIDSLTLRHYSLARYSTIQNDPSLKSSKKLNKSLYSRIFTSLSRKTQDLPVCVGPVLRPSVKERYQPALRNSASRFAAVRSRDVLPVSGGCWLGAAETLHSWSLFWVIIWTFILFDKLLYRCLTVLPSNLGLHFVNTLRTSGMWNKTCRGFIRSVITYQELHARLSLICITESNRERYAIKRF